MLTNVEKIYQPVNEIAVIIPDGYEDAGCRDIILADRNGYTFHKISPNHAAYMPLHYVLLFPNGEHGRWERYTISLYISR